MSKEWNQHFIKEMDKYKNIILLNYQKGQFLPRYILTENFFKEYFILQEKLIKNPSGNPFLKFSNYQEYRVVKLLKYLNIAKNKYYKNKSDQNQGNLNKMDIGENEIDYKNTESTSQLILVNKIIKNSFELTSFVNLLEWLQSIYLKDESSRISSRQPLFFEKTKKKLYESGNNFHQDLMNYDNEIIDREEMEKFSKIMETIIINVRQGKLEEAQIIAEYNNQHFLSAMLNGGLPMNDFLLDKYETLGDVDFDLFPPFMKTKELKEIEQNPEKFISNPDLNSENVENVYDKVVGNPDWLLWFYSVYEGCNINQTPNGKPFNWQIKLLQTFLSGNSSYIDANEYNVYELLYTYILSMLNFKLIQEYQNSKRIDYRYVESDEPDFSKNFKEIKGKNIIDIIKLIKSTQKYKEAVKNDFMLEIELDLIQLHFIDYVCTLNEAHGNNSYYEHLNELLFKMINIFHENEDFEAYVKTHFNLIDNISQPKESRLSKNEQQERMNSNVMLIKLNYSKILFTTLISYNSTNFSRLQIGENEYRSNEKKFQAMLKIVKKFDILISNFFLQITEISTNPKNLVHILAFAYDLRTIEINLSALANRLSDAESYKSLVAEIELYFEGFEEALKTSIASNTHIYDMESTVSSIDEILERELKTPFEICEDDLNKINQVMCLFSEGKLDKYTILKYIMKLSLKFLSKNKFKAATELQRRFQNILDIKSILNKTLITKEKLLDDQNFVFFIEKFSFNENYQRQELEYDISELGIYFTVLFNKIILECYFNYLKLKENILKELKFDSKSSLNNQILITSLTKNNLNKNYKDVIVNFNQIISLIRVIVVNEDLREILINFFGEDTFIKDIRVIIANWIYQVLKWTVDIHTEKIFQNANFINDEKSLDLLSRFLTISEDVLLKGYIQDLRPTILENEKTFYKFMDDEKRKRIPQLIYQLTKTNKDMMNEIFDKDFENELKNDLDEYDF